MRCFGRLAQTLLTSTLAAVAALSLPACDPGYTYYKVVIVSAQGTSTKENPPTRGTAREYLENCYITICTSTPCKSGGDSSNKVLEKRLLEVISGGPGVNNQQGCSGGATPLAVGTFHYSTTRSGKDLHFTVEGFDSGSNTGDNGQAQIIQAGSKSPPYGSSGQPELEVNIAMEPVLP